MALKKLALTYVILTIGVPALTFFLYGQIPVKRFVIIFGLFGIFVLAVGIYKAKYFKPITIEVKQRKEINSWIYVISGLLILLNSLGNLLLGKQDLIYYLGLTLGSLVVIIGGVKLKKQ